MERVKGVAGVFVYSPDSDHLRSWYRENLGVSCSLGDPNGVSYHEFFSQQTDSERTRRLTWSVFPREFQGSHGAKVVYHVDDLDALLLQLAGNDIEPFVREDFAYGRFAWLRDPDDNVIGLFQDLEY
jgi:hypothetical protein